MQYSRAGLVALLFTLTISLVSAFPVPATESIISSTLSSRTIPELNGLDHIEIDTPGIPKISLSGRMSTLPLATRLARRVRYTALSTYLLVLSTNLRATANSGWSGGSVSASQYFRQNKARFPGIFESIFLWKAAWYKILINWLTIELRPQNQIWLPGMY